MHNNVNSLNIVLGDDPMEDMIKKIIEIDHKAFEQKQVTEMKIKENEKKLKEIFANMETEIIQKAKDEAEKKYKAEIENFAKTVNEIKEQGEYEIKKLEEKFNIIHEELSQSLFKEIFELS
ncbi:hypothetical protein [Defluviitalea saccharophila]|uniref:ATPase n=1 Tax=Defluviitalea saccharophila TaxID=879970 RepID=A0ABZ2Y6C2_9FIRM|nr:hypothetical protein [Candidatus Epulonipiscium sp.]